ncbi:hypothetical protein E5F05_17010 [Deinococcus metallilatus]|uniref:DUF4097 domain-containing protein n=1 Tax=Deinococcus metallilatus TaxID=1211322 RepID=A0AAJ5JZ21_9DEIO|nr:hypothetical protein [Deinococcus metallilatus]MBB5294789.1 hypothetical protein [Deinococcus metallilatus]QBY09489.1 hypothetical protein E5F05_17010 [Deinococcus metallilatus]RXJ09494.1 hypothetical protein ERJ73_15850 [Deinococcus metallilatus]TLK29016.1 DUF4097 domain-containing protein [Deinococcus metallilatus]GMA16715.1 hypothetical protein GCM10025871_30460 [Deinococcus metallilatus]
MTVAERTPPRPLAPVLARIALGLALVGGGAWLGWHGKDIRPTPGLNAVQTPLNLPLNGAEALTLRLEGDRTDLTVGGLAWPGRAALTGSATHRERNPLRVQVMRDGATLNADLRLNVKPLDEGVIRVGTPSLQHKLEVRLTRAVPVTLTTDTYSGETRLDLHALRVRTLNVRSGFGRVVATLPERQSGPLTFVTLGGDVTLHARPAWRAPALRVNTESGDVRLDLAAARVESLSVGVLSGDVTGYLPRTDRISVASGHGNVALDLPDGAAGTLDLRSEGGRVALTVPRDVSLRVRFTDRTALHLPPGLRRQGNTAATDAHALNDPDLDLFIDAQSADLSLRDPGPEGDAPS